MMLIKALACLRLHMDSQAMLQGCACLRDLRSRRQDRRCRDKQQPKRADDDYLSHSSITMLVLRELPSAAKGF